MRLRLCGTQILEHSQLNSTLKSLQVHPCQGQSSYYPLLQEKDNSISSVCFCHTLKNTECFTNLRVILSVCFYGIFKALNVNLLKIRVGSSLCKCETYKCQSPCSSCEPAASVCQLLDLWQQGERDWGMQLNPKLCRWLPGCLGALTSSGKPRVLWYLAH